MIAIGGKWWAWKMTDQIPVLRMHPISSMKTSSSAVAKRPRCRVGQFWPKVEDDILRTI